MAHLKLVLVLALASQNGIAMQSNSEFLSPTALRIFGSSAVAMSAGALYYSAKLAQENCPTKGCTVEEAPLASFVYFGASMGCCVTALIAFFAAQVQSQNARR